MTVPARLSIPEYERLNHRDVSLGNHSIHYLDEGEGFPLVLVHGSPTTSALWRHQIPTLSKRFRVIAPDVLGFGRSVAPDEGGSFAKQADALRALLDYLHIDRYSFVGHDWGGPVSTACAAQRPDQIHQWVLINTTFRPTYQPPWYWKPFTARLTGHLLLIRANLWGRKLSNMMRAASDPAIGEHYLEASQPVGNRRTFLRLERLEGYPALMQQVVDALPSLPKAPLILWGTHDAYFRNEHSELKALLPEARLVMLDGGGHFPQEDAPDTVTAELNAYLAPLGLPS
ncbi:MAG: alpha/beta fold hydrolase [Deltaproteobacteria bacterium]|nr:alpha/beta fold hydrolase [Deltaproteobacteria bacterium]MBW2379621.1 alpha/beta fold hydrolase [Deltaproteobacteria bacterium]